MSVRNHVIITGTGRSGTTFLVELLTNLGLETGFSIDEIASKKSRQARAGLEYDVRQDDCPFIVKNPKFCDYAEEVIRRDDIVIEHIFVPVRDLHAAAESRRHVVKIRLSDMPFLKRLKHRVWPRKFDGGLWSTDSVRPGSQEKILQEKIYKLILATSNTVLPITFMRYPKITKDCPYLFEKLKPVLGDISYEYFCSAFSKTVRPELVNSFNDNDKAATVLVVGS